MSIKRIPFFLAAAKYLNFTEAANELYVSQTAISLQIKNYEEEIGFKLFSRSNTGVVLTPAGSYLYKQCRRIMAEYNNAVTRAHELATDLKPVLKIAYSGAYEQWAVTGLTKKYYTNYPDYQIELLYSKSKKEALRQLEEGEIDIAIIASYDRNYNKLLESRIIKRNLCVFMLSDDNPLAGRATLDPEELAGVPILQTSENDFDPAGKVSSRLYEELGLGDNRVVYASDFFSIALMVRAGLGFAIVPDAMRQFSGSGLSYIPISGRQIWEDCSVVYMSEKENPIIEDFLALIDYVEPPIRRQFG